MSTRKIIECVFLIVFVAMQASACSKKNVEASITPPRADARTYYVSNTGSESNAGSINTPFQTINKALSHAVRGDTVMVRGGTYYEKVVFPKSGMIDKRITLKAYPGEKAIISGESLPVNGNEGLITMNSVSWISIEGFDICNFKTYNAWVNVDGIVVKGSSSHIIIRKNRVFNIENNATPEQGRSGHGIHILGNTVTPITKVLVEGNEIFDCNTGYSENLTINGYVDGFEIRNNKVYNGENIGIVAAGGYTANSNPAYNYVRNGVIADNEVFNINGKSGPIPAYKEHNGAIGIYVDGARNIIVERNTVYASGRGIGVVSETDNFPTQECMVRNNFIYNCSLAGILLGGYIGYTGGGTNKCKVVNNTLYHNNKDLGYFNEVEGEIRLTENCNDNIIKNNIIYPRPERGVFVNKQTIGGTNNIIDYNLYYSEGENIWRWNNVPYTDFNSWKIACRGDSVSSVGIDPQFVSISTPDIHIKSSSPAKNTGQVISVDTNGATDIDGNTRIVNNKISKGAHQ